MSGNVEAVLGAEEDVRRVPTAKELALEDLEQGSSLWSDAWHRLQRNRLALISLFLFLAICLFCISALSLRVWQIVSFWATAYLASATSSPMANWRP